MQPQEVDTPQGPGIVLGWGQDKDFPHVAAGEIVVKLTSLDKRNIITSFSPDQVIVNE